MVSNPFFLLFLIYVRNSHITKIYLKKGNMFIIILIFYNKIQFVQLVILKFLITPNPNIYVWCILLKRIKRFQKIILFNSISLCFSIFLVDLTKLIENSFGWILFYQYFVSFMKSYIYFPYVGELRNDKLMNIFLGLL